MSEAEGVVVSAEDAQYIIERQRYEIGHWQAGEVEFLVTLLQKIELRVRNLPDLTADHWHMLEDRAATLGEAARSRRPKATADER